MEVRLKYAITAGQAQRIDSYTIEKIGIPSLVLMERAALSIAEEILKNPDEVRVLAVCGNGNNGADGIAAARILFTKGVAAEVLISGSSEKYSEQFRKQLDIAVSLGMKISDYSTLEGFDEYDIIIDAIFGTGLSRKPDGIVSALIRRINASGAVVISADVPSGISASDGSILGEAVKADITVTFGMNKTGLLLYPAADYAGRVIVADIGFPKDVMKSILEPSESCFTYYEEGDLKELLPKRHNDSNKGSYGRVFIAGGFCGMTGAALLSAEAAYRTGAGLVKVYTSQETASVMRLKLPEAMISRHGKEEVFASVKWSTVTAAGVGMGTGKESEELLDMILEACREYDRPLIIDADAVNILALKADRAEMLTIKDRLAYLGGILPNRVIFTPHIKEASRLLKVSVEEIKANMIDILSKCAYNNYVYVFKDARTLVAYRDKRYINISGNNGMSTGGSGDVLTGITAAVLAAGGGEYEAAAVSVFVHGLAGDRAASKYGVRPMLAGDIIDVLKEI